jgi:tRNA pseudouridine13 synthase
VRPAHERERAVGIDHYVSDADGVGGRLRERPEHFRVEELEDFATEPVDADPGAYPFLVVRATLHGWDTNDFAARLADGMGASRERVDWAGTKDKHAVTTQLFSVRDADPADLPDVDGADVEVVGRAGRNLQFGDLAGNRFRVVVAEPGRPENADAVTADLRAFAGGEGGEGDGGDDGSSAAVPGGDDGSSAAVPNYFGQQRFGSRRPVTHEVGLALARGSWEDAVLAYVGNPHEDEPEPTREARAYAEETRDWRGAVDRFPGGLRFERAMCHELAENGAENPADFRAALETAPTNLQRLFVNAAQSYVFNRILSERLERGLPFDRPVEGDVVCFTDREAPRASGGASGRSPRADDAPSGVTVPDPDRTQRVTEGRVRSVTRHCERGRAFVTAPLVGTETDLGDGEPGEIERVVLDEVGLVPGDFDLPGEFGSTGTRRAVLVRTDLTVERDPLALSFALPKGSYATVLLREYLKADPLDM